MNNFPKAGQIYYHYKHNSEKGILDYCYKIIGIGFNTETEGLVVIYQPLYAKETINKNATFYVRQVEIFMEKVEKPEINYFGPRFRLVEDEGLSRKLNE
jgi:hypothetical protein